MFVWLGGSPAWLIPNVLVRETSVPVLSQMLDAGRRNAVTAPTLRERAVCLVLGSLVNAFTNYRNVKGELRQKIRRVMDVTHHLPGLWRYPPTPHHNIV